MSDTLFTESVTLRVMSKPPQNTGRMTVGDRLRHRRLQLGLTLEEVAERAGMSLITVHRRETGERPVKVHELEPFSRALECEPEDLLDDSARMVPVVGRVGAGAQVFPIDDVPEGVGLYRVRCPVGMDPASTVAVEVVGNSMYPEIDEGWLLFYTRDHDFAADEILGKRAVVKIANDGPTLIKRVARGPTTGRFNLISANAPMIEDVELEWAAPICAVIAPRRGGG